MKELTYITHLPNLTSKLQELQFSVDWWQRCYAEAGEQADKAWEEYDRMIEKEMPYSVVNDWYTSAALFEDISLDAWHEWQQAKRNLLDLYN